MDSEKEFEFWCAVTSSLAMVKENPPLGFMVVSFIRKIWEDQPYIDKADLVAEVLRSVLPPEAIQGRKDEKVTEAYIDLFHKVQFMVECCWLCAEKTGVRPRRGFRSFFRHIASEHQP